MEIIDFSNCQFSDRNLQYAGRAGEKRGIIYNNQYWFLKFPKNTIGMSRISGLSYVTSPLSEYIGSNIYKILGFDVHETILGVCFDGKRYKVVCACKDFIIDDKNELLIPYTALRNDTNPIIMERRDSSFQSASNINEIIFQLENNTILSKIPNVKNRFWSVVIIDMIINNNDRNEDNWGVIKFKKENSYILAPIFDCGNSFYGKNSDEKIANILNDQERLFSSAINGITAYEDDSEKRISNIEIIKLDNKDLKIAINDVASKIINKFDEIKEFINSIPEYYKETLIISKERKDFYIKTTEIRIKSLLKDII